ncbi:MAG TPA: CARDB domain-containing protein, partial [Solirubrobacteraceae bacterium]|nr:CARDB domain-containing protein [Solirubrobacteraceae bacterium]
FPTAGNFNTVVDVNPAHEVPETNYLNDIAAESITVVAAKSSFAITSYTIAPNPPDPTDAVVEGRPALATITVENTGNVAAGPAEVQWTPLKSAKPLSAALSSGLLPGESETVELEFTYTKTGLVSAKAVVTAPGRLTPFASSTLEPTVEAPLANIRISNVTAHPNFAGSPSTLEVTIENDGNAGAGHFVVEWQPGLFQTAQVQQVASLGEFESQTLTFSKVYAKGGTYDGLVTADSKHEVEELFTTEKTAKTTLEVPEPTVDLAVTGLQINPAEPIQQKPATVTMTVENVGNRASPAFVTAWNPDAKKVSVPSLKAIVHEETTPLMPGESRSITFPFTYPQPGNFLSVAEVNPGHTVKETNYNNNMAVLAVTVAPQPVELEFTSATINVLPPSGIVALATKVEAQVTVIDRSHLATGPFAVELTPRVGGKAQTQTVSGLNEGQSKTLDFKNIVYLASGKYQLTALLDPKDQVVKTPAGIHEATAEVEVEKCKIKLICK